MILTKKQLLIGALLAVFIGVALWQPFFLDAKKIEQGSDLLQQSQSAGVESSDDLGLMVEPEVDAETKKQISQGFHYTEKDIREITQSATEGIAGTAFNNSDYAVYDEATLKKMADSGDVMAMKALWLRYFKNDDHNDIEQMNELVNKAIVYGDREMFTYMPELNDLNSRFGNPNATPEKKHSAMIDILAYHEFMGLRGYLIEKYHGQSGFFRMNSTPEAPISLTETDKEAVCARAKEIYAAYEAERIKLGLGAFDNSVSDGQKKMYERQQEVYLQEMGDNAI